MRLILLGTGTSVSDPARGGPAALISLESDHYLVDCGSGTTARLAEAGVWPEQVHTLLFTHHDAEQTLDYGHFVLSAWTRGRAQPLTVYGPPGSQRITDCLLERHAHDITTRLKRDRLDPNGVRIDCHECGAGTVLQRPGLTVTAAGVNDGEAGTALAYRFDGPGRSIVIAGDAPPGDALANLARGCDVLVHGAAGDNAAVERVGALAARAGAKTLALTCGTANGNADALRAGARGGFAGRVVIGHDLLTL